MFYTGLRLSKEITDCMYVDTLGSSHKIPEGVFKKAYNYRNSKDCVTFFSPWLVSLQSTTIDTGYSSGRWHSMITDHYLSSPGYQKVLKKNIEKRKI